MNVLVTGGSGFIGSHLVKELFAKGDSVSVITRSGLLPDRMTDVKCKVWKGSFSDEELLDKALEGIDAVIHLAWSSVPSVDYKTIGSEINENVIGTIKLLDKCIKWKVKKFIFISSGGTVYGIPQQVPITEDHSSNPISSYGIGKASIEKYLYLYNKLTGIDYSVFRISNAYGEHQNLSKGQGVLGIWLNQIMGGKDIEIWGDGNIIRDYIYVQDVVQIISDTLDKKLQNRVYNLGSGKGVSLNEIVELIKKQVTEDFNVHYYEARNIDVPANILDVSRLQNELNYAPAISLEEGIVNVWNWLKTKNEI